MERKEFLEMVDRYLSGMCSREEADLVERFCDEMEENPLDANRLFLHEERIKSRIFNHIRASIADKEKKKIIKRYFLRWSYAAAAAVLILLGVGIYSWFFKSGSDAPPMIVFETGIGEQKHIKLDDGTQVWLNAKSRLTYPKAFSEDKRRVTLSGEAFFDVAKNPFKPFVIKTDELLTTVLGTSFNVKSYPEDETTAVGVVTGSVRVAAIKAQRAAVLKPEQMITLDKSAGTFKRIAMDKGALSWRMGRLSFDDITIYELTKMLERHYDAVFEFHTETIKNRHISGQLKLDSLDMILKNLSFLTDLKFLRIEQKRILVKE